MQRVRHSTPSHDSGRHTWPAGENPRVEDEEISLSSMVLTDPADVWPQTKQPSISSLQGKLDSEEFYMWRSKHSGVFSSSQSEHTYTHSNLDRPTVEVRLFIRKRAAVGFYQADKRKFCCTSTLRGMCGCRVYAALWLWSGCVFVHERRFGKPWHVNSTTHWCLPTCVLNKQRAPNRSKYRKTVTSSARWLGNETWTSGLGTQDTGYTRL